MAMDEKTAFVVGKVKEIVYRFDPNAEIILFGSRARGDWHNESDWDFLVLTEESETETLGNDIRKAVQNEIELVTFDGVFVLVKNKKVWEEDHSVTPLYYNVAEEGLPV